MAAELDEDHETRRRWPWIVAAVVTSVLLLAAALLSGRAWGRHGQVEVWQVTHNLAAGTVLRASDLRTVEVSAAGASGAIPGDRPPVGAVTGSLLPAGTVLHRDVLSAAGVVPGPGEALVGVAATAGLSPDGLRPGTR